MIIISSKNIPEQALAQLKDYGKVLTFETSEYTYPAISCHPDVFLCFSEDNLIIAPNTPKVFKRLLLENNVKYVEGKLDAVNNYPATARYNAVITKNYLIHNLEITDRTIKEVCTDKKKIHVKQGYTRCNLLPLQNDNFITSDKGIYHTLINKKLNVLYVSPQGILLPDFKYGFFGGTCGVYQKYVFTIGSLSELTDSNKVTSFLRKVGHQVIELHKGPLLDCGSLIFID